jgi:hypothetical protein
MLQMLQRCKSTSYIYFLCNIDVTNVTTLIINSLQNKNRLKNALLWLSVTNVTSHFWACYAQVSGNQFCNIVTFVTRFFEIIRPKSGNPTPANTVPAPWA